MLSWIKDNLGLKGSLILIIGVLFMIGFFIGPSILNSIKREQYKGIAKAQITNIVEREMAIQDYSGGRVETFGYDVTYTFSVDSIQFTKTVNIRTSFDIKTLFIKFKSSQPCIIEVNYSKENPHNSIISKLSIDK